MLVSIQEIINDYHRAQRERDAIQTDLDDTGYKDYSNAITHVVMGSVINWFYYHVKKIKLVESDGN